MNDVIRADYDELTKIASAFDREADRLRQSFQQVLRTVEVLRGGDWVGQGAAAFFREMDSDVIPAMKRLPSALEAAGRTTRDIAQNTKDAEDEIVRLFAGLFGLGSGAAIAAAVGAGIGQALGTAAGALAGAAQAVAAAATAARQEAAARVQGLIDAGDHQGAIDEAARAYGIDLSHIKGKPTYDTNVQGEGVTRPDGTVGIGTDAFTTPAELASTVGHEALHAQQLAEGRWYPGKQGLELNEVECYDWEIANAPRTGLSQAEIAEVTQRRQAHYNDLTPANRRMVDGGKYGPPKI